jgi:hypothetical protein
MVLIFLTSLDLWDDLEDEHLEGSSRTVGGIIRGRAMGNTPAIVDFDPQAAVHLQQPKGRVYLHVHEESQPYSMLHPVGSDLPSVLNGLSNLYSPIKHHNAHICVQEDGVWELKGRFMNAVRMGEGLPWVKDEKGMWSVTLQAETPTSVPSNPSIAAPSNLQPSALPASDSGSLQEQIVALLNILEMLVQCGRSGDICLAYAKYKGFLQAQSDMQKMKANGTWTLGTVSVDALIKVFAAKSVWYSYHAKYFPWVSKYPHLICWLESGSDARPTYEIWGSEKTSYSFTDLKDLLNQLDICASKKKEKRERESEEKRFDEARSSKKQKRVKSCDDDVSVISM